MAASRKDEPAPDVDNGLAAPAPDEDSKSKDAQAFADLLQLCTRLINDPALPDLPESLAHIPEVVELHGKISKLREAMSCFSKGAFDHKLSASGICAGYLKALQANIRHLNWQVRAVADGDFTQSLTFMGELSESFNEMTKKLAFTVQRLTNKEEELLGLTAELKQEIEARIKVEVNLRASESRYRKMAVYDWLTGVYNRRHFMELAQSELGRSLRGGMPMSLVMLDVDHFKQFNDAFGHLNGDLCLQHVAGVITSTVRRMDVVARFGGEEFVIMLPETELETAFAVAERIRATLEALPVKLELGETATITASLGVTEVQQDSDLDLENMAMQAINWADMAMYQAKTAGRNKVKIVRNGVLLQDDDMTR